MAEHIAREILPRALRHEPKMTSRSWAFTTATNLLREAACRDTRKRQRLEQLYAEQELNHEKLPEPPAANDSPIQQALQSLNERDRTALLLSKEGLSYHEIVMLLAMSMQTIGTALTRVNKRMIRHYKSLTATAITKGSRAHK